MSEYQYYEFQAIDRPLTSEEQAAVAGLSSRTEPHPWRVVFKIVLPLKLAGSVGV
jgi:hypothetical protein